MVYPSGEQADPGLQPVPWPKARPFTATGTLKGGVTVISASTCRVLAGEDVTELFGVDGLGVSVAVTVRLANVPALPPTAVFVQLPLLELVEHENPDGKLLGVKL